MVVDKNFISITGYHLNIKTDHLINASIRNCSFVDHLSIMASEVDSGQLGRSEGDLG